jgi:YrbI family 3-deoxy-D-manno-octulosonate 8-phosphate phosphatase
MNVIAIILARGGSKGVFNKNLQTILGISLLGKAIVTCSKVSRIDRIYVSTDSEAIAEEARRFGAIPLKRVAELASDEASSEAGIDDAIVQINLIEGANPKVVVFIQCTSPFLEETDLSEALDSYLENPEGTLFSATPTHDFHWEISYGEAVPVSESALHRTRRQELVPRYRESGAFYIFTSKSFVATKNRFIEPIKIHESPNKTSIEIDSYEDLEIARALAGVRKFQALPGNIKVLFTDFDGVHTDNYVYQDSNGLESVRVSRADGLAVQIFKNLFITVVMLSSEKNPVVKARADKLNIECIYGVSNKLVEIQDWCLKSHINLNEVGFIGNDLNDLEAMNNIGLPIAVADASKRIKDISKVVLESKGGESALRELADMFINSNYKESGDLK